jgi:predicted site-specific integrase-resolvase
MTEAPTFPGPEYVDAIERIAGVCGVSRLTALRWLREGRIPKPDIVMSRETRLWRREVVEDFLAAKSS